MNVPRKLLYVVLFFALIAAAGFALNYFNIQFKLPEIEMPAKGFTRALRETESYSS